MAIDRTRVITGAATREGTAVLSGNAIAVHIQADDTTAAVVVDGIGHSPRVAAVAQLLDDVTARVAARRGGLAALLTATELVADPGAGDEPEPDAVAVVATVEEDDNRIRIAWVGDSRAYALKDGRLQRLTADHNLAEHLALSR